MAEAKDVSETKRSKGPTARRGNSMEGIPPFMSEDTLETRETEEERETRDTGERQRLRETMELEGQIKKLKLEGQMNKLQLEKQIKELEIERRIKDLELEKRIMGLEMEGRIKDLEKQIMELYPPLPTHTLHGPTARRGNSMEGIPPFMSEDTLDTPETEEERETVERRRGDQNTRQTREETTATEQETPVTSSQDLQRASTSESVFSSVRATEAQENPGATLQRTQERRQESDLTEQVRSSTDIQSQEHEETASQSVSSLADAETQTQERPRDRTQ